MQQSLLSLYGERDVFDIKHLLSSICHGKIKLLAPPTARILVFSLHFSSNSTVLKLTNWLEFSCSQICKIHLMPFKDLAATKHILFFHFFSPNLLSYSKQLLF